VKKPAFLSAPIFEDEQRSLVAGALHGILVILGGALLFVLPVLLYNQNYQ